MTDTPDDGVPVDTARFPFEIRRAADAAGVDLDRFEPPYILERVDDDMTVTDADSGQRFLAFPLWRVAEIDSELLRQAVNRALPDLLADHVGQADQFITASNAGAAEIRRPPDEDWVEVTIPGADDVSFVVHRSFVVVGWPPGLE
jgi:hypothetical protein